MATPIRAGSEVTGSHTHPRGDEVHRHYRDNGKTYFANEHRKDGMPVKCEGHASLDLTIVDDWCYL
jgi:hypothetical protein